MIHQICRLVANSDHGTDIGNHVYIMPIRGAVAQKVIRQRSEPALDDCGYAVTRSRNARTAALNAAG